MLKKVIFFYMNRCNRCSKLKEGIKAFLNKAELLGYEVSEVNAAENIDLADKYYLDDMPAIIVINGDREVKVDGELDFGLLNKEIENGN
jgi:hypothetical protein